MSGVETGVVRYKEQVDNGPKGPVQELLIYALGPRDFKGPRYRMAIPQLVVGRQGDRYEGAVHLGISDPTIVEESREKPIDDGRSAIHILGRLVTLTFKDVQTAGIDDNLPVDPGTLDVIRRLVIACNIDLEEGTPGEPGSYHFIPNSPVPVA